MRFSFVSLTCLVAMLSMLWAAGESPQVTAEDNQNKSLGPQIQIIDRGGLVNANTDALPQYQQFWVIDSPDRQEVVSEEFGYPIPNIDFNEHVMLFLFQGVKTSGGYDIRATSFKIEKERIVVNVTLNEPGPTCATTAAFTSPFELIKVPKSNLPIVFIPKAQVRPCP